MSRITITNRQRAVKLDHSLLKRVVRDVLRHEGIEEADISLVFVGDEEMHALNRRHLAHDYPTDVLSFLLDESATETGRSIEAEIIVSTEFAAQTAPRFDWTTDEEVTLYVVHGLLHACGYDDLTSKEKSRMRRAERSALKRHGLEPRYRGRK
ncbi:MAG: rRNA maturation RNase YbeY [Planctomycetaceae bacterium]|nr:rRNA maturation RNase YbeY [Planctomycetaceae bacterium]